MHMLGTDVMALTCILGGAAVSGGATLAALSAQHGHSPSCVVEAVAMVPDMVVSEGGHSHAVVVTPNVRFRALPGCGREAVDRVRVRVDTDLRAELAAEVRSRVEREMERAQAEIERARAEMERGQVDRAREWAEMERAHAEVERALAQMQREGKVIIR